MTRRRTIIKAGIVASILTLKNEMSMAVNSPGTADSEYFPYSRPLGNYPQPEFIRDALRLHFGSALNDKKNLFKGWDDRIIAHGMAKEPVNKSTLIDFYTFVFSSFPDFRLVDDSLLIAGDMGAHRYHALGTHTGGPKPTGKKIMFRGQTIYRINEYGKVIWRTSNHDHDFREEQLAYPGEPILQGTRRSWAPHPYAKEPHFDKHDNLDELVLRNKVARLICDASNNSARESYWEMYQPEAMIRGLDPDKPLTALPLQALQIEYQRLWSAIPDLAYLTGELIICNNYAIHQWYASGHHTGKSLYGTAPSGKEVLLREETIYRFDNNYKIAERWINHDRDYLLNQLSSG